MLKNINTDRIRIRNTAIMHVKLTLVGEYRDTEFMFAIPPYLLTLLGMKSFLGMGETVMLLTVQDPAATTRSGYNTNKQISVFHNTNRYIGLNPLPTIT